MATITDLQIQIKVLKGVLEKVDNTAHTTALEERIRQLEAENAALRGGGAAAEEGEEEDDGEEDDEEEGAEGGGKRRRRRKKKARAKEPPMAFHSAEGLFGDIYEEKAKADIIDVERGNNVDTFSEFIRKFFITKYGVGPVAVSKRKGFISVVRHSRDEAERFRTFAILLGIEEDRWFAEHTQVCG